ncbi:MAG: Minf_1886 family protein [Planctomycetota bacterium]|jgi:uncharacterized repeat protein (TIGR04138 family)
MASEKTESILGIVRRDPRFGSQAYYFIFDALDFTLARLGNARHVTGVELLKGIRGHAVEQFGFLARTVLAEWGVHHTEDFGDIVFNLVDAGLLSRSEHDTPEDFRRVYDFEEAFERDFRKSLDEVTLGV